MRYKSGSSVGGKTRVNQHARLRLKSLFDLEGRPVPRNVCYPNESELQDYYQRKLSEGKNKMLQGRLSGAKCGS